MAKGEGRSLTRREFDAVIRRAAELAASAPEEGDGQLTEAELFRIAGEVGLEPTHVRTALAEVRTEVVEEGWLDRVFGPTDVRASRIVPGKPEALGVEIDDFMVASQLLQRVRRGVNVLQYRPALDWASQLARAASFTSSKYYVASAKSVEVRLEAVDDHRTYVEIEVDPGTRGDDLAGAVFGGGAAGAAGGTGVGIGLTALAAPAAVAIAGGILVGGGLIAVITHYSGRSHRKKLQDVTAELEGILDVLELGDSLEPPPPSWRRWVKRHFHGVARDLSGMDEGL